MIKNYLLLTLRKILHNRSYALINIMGLAVGLASFIIIMLYVYDEYSYDKYHAKHERIYRIASEMNFKGVGEKSSSQPFPLGETLYKDYPEYIENFVRFFNLQKSVFTVAYEDRVFNETRFFYADTSVFSIFDFNLISGDKYKVLKEPFTIVITKSTAKKYFGNENPVGKSLKVDNRLEYEITGVVEDVPAQSHFKFDFLASFASLKYMFRSEQMLKDWVWNPCWTYILLKPENRAGKLAEKLPDFVNKYIKIGKNERYELYLQALDNIHLQSNLDYEIEKNGKEEYVQILMIIAILILSIASINFINLATAGTANRAKEIGIKKVVGGTRNQLVLQFLIESLIITFISLLIAISLVELFLPAFSNISGKVVSNDFRFRFETIAGLFVLGVLTAIISGIYPALYMSGLAVLKLLRGIIRQSKSAKKVRKMLVLVQLTISIALIIVAVGIFMQLKYLHTKDLGFKNREIIILNSEFSNIAFNFNSFKNDLLKDSLIKYVTGMDYIIGQSHNTHFFVPENYPETELQFYPSLFVRDDFVKTFDITIVAGKDFTENEKRAGKEVLVNEEMLNYLGYEDYDSILGKKFRTSQGSAEVRGVISNINVSSLHTKVEPFIISIYSSQEARTSKTRFVAIQVQKEHLDKSLKHIEMLWNKYEPNRPFEYLFLKNELDKHYKGENVLADLAGIFTLLSIVISSIGIWALTAYITETRTKEIGIRKVLGASLWNIVKLINKEFAGIFLLANLIAWTLAYYALRIWIDNFAYRIEISFWIFLAALMFSLFNVVLTISHKSLIAASKNPVDALKYE
ncbi:MAG: ABC transporter permease [Bacteroidales bacterium]|nr:ABC transporter permease [Bacteroidales bacterium]